jgi:hypothetical protein
MQLDTHVFRRRTAPSDPQAQQHHPSLRCASAEEDSAAEAQPWWEAGGQSSQSELEASSTEADGDYAEREAQALDMMREAIGIDLDDEVSTQHV